MSPIRQQQKEQLKAVASQARSQVEEGLVHFRHSLQMKAALFALMGICALFWPSTSMKYLVMLIGVCCILDGMGGLFSATRGIDGRSYVGGAVVSLLVGAVLLFWPNAIAVLLKLFGALVLYIGIRNILVSRQLSETDPERATVRTTGIVASVIGLVLFLWPGVGVGALSWVLAIAALLVAALLLFVASRLQRITSRVAR